MKLLLLCLFSVCSSVTLAQTSTFNIATFNVDGLPQELIGIDINSGGPGSAGTKRIGACLEASGWDIIGINEDFNYHSELTSAMPSYNFQQYTGNIYASWSTIAGVIAKTYRFQADGLEMATKKNIKVSNETIVPWNNDAVYGYFDHDNDSLTMKGFRYYTVTLADGHKLDVMILHADASGERQDVLAREAGMTQMYDFIVKNIKTENPLIVMGDYNCRYSHDRLQELFIDRLNAIPGLSMKDASIEIGYSQEYLDKILYLNRDNAICTITPTKVQFIDSFTWDDGSQLSDHRPLAAAFTITDKPASGISSLTSSNESGVTVWYDLQGMKHNTMPRNKGIYIKNGHKIIIK